MALSYRRVDILRFLASIGLAGRELQIPSVSAKAALAKAAKAAAAAAATGPRAAAAAAATAAARSSGTAAASAVSATAARQGMYRARTHSDTILRSITTSMHIQV